MGALSQGLGTTLHDIFLQENMYFLNLSVQKSP